MKTASLLLLLLCASVSRADGALDRLATELASEDPAVRAAAREELLQSSERRVPALRAKAATVTDAEARAALLEIAELIEEGRPLECAKKFARKVVSRKLLLDDVRNWKVSPVAVFCCWLTRAELVVEEAPVDGRDEWAPPLKAKDLEEAGERWLEAWTLADFGDDADAWAVFRSRVRDWSWTEIRLEGLTARGFRVREKDANVAAREFLSAGRIEGNAERRTVRAAAAEATESFQLLLVQVFKGCPAMDPEEFAVDDVLDWIEACGETWQREGDRFVSSAGPDDFLSATRSPRSGVALAALEELRRWPDRIPADCWRLVEANPSLVTRAMHDAGIAVPKDRLAAVLRAMGSREDPRLVKEIWKSPDLAALARDREADPGDRERALRCLARIDPEAAAVAGSAVLDDYIRKAHADEHTVGRAAAVAAAATGTAEALDRAEAWLRLAPENYERIDVAIALARQGRRAGFDILVDRASRDLLDRRRCARARKCIEGAPSAENDDEWVDWAVNAGTNYAWDAQLKKWKAAK